MAKFHSLGATKAAIQADKVNIVATDRTGDNIVSYVVPIKCRYNAISFICNHRACNFVFVVGRDYTGNYDVIHFVLAKIFSGSYGKFDESKFTTAKQRD